MRRVRVFARVCIDLQWRIYTLSFVRFPPPRGTWIDKTDHWERARPR